MADASKEKKPDSVNNEFEELIRRVRLLEERFSNLRKKSDFDEQSMLKDTKEIFEQITTLETNIGEIKSEISELNEKLTKLAEEISQTAKRNELNVFTKYIEYWQPMNFLTREEAEKIIYELKNSKNENNTSFK